MKKTMKKIELGVNTNSVKVQFNTSTSEFREIVGEYWVAIVEMADMTKIYKNNVEIFEKSVNAFREKLEKGVSLSESEKALFDSDKAKLDEYNKKWDTFRTNYNARTEKCYGIITDELYKAYVSYIATQKKSGYRSALKTWIGKYGIEVTDSLVDFLLSVIGARKTSANKKVTSKGKTLLTAHTRKSFNELFMHALSQLMVDKNCIKPENYTFVYEKDSDEFIKCEKIDEVVLVEKESEDKSEDSKDSKEDSSVKKLNKKTCMELLDKAGISYKKSAKLSELIDLVKTIKTESESTEA